MKSHALLDSAERANRQLSQEIFDARLAAVTEMKSINSREVAVKRNPEGRDWHHKEWSGQGQD